MYWKYFFYILGHKWNVFVECLITGQPIHGILHDLSKFLPSEFIPYARFFFAKDKTNIYKETDEKDLNFLKGWCYHQKRNKHHWNYWVCINRKNEIIPIPMPAKYIAQMLADWRGMSRKFGGTPKAYYEKDSMILHSDTIKIIEKELWL